MKTIILKQDDDDCTDDNGCDILICVAAADNVDDAMMMISVRCNTIPGQFRFAKYQLMVNTLMYADLETGGVCI